MRSAMQLGCLAILAFPPAIAHAQQSLPNPPGRSMAFSGVLPIVSGQSVQADVFVTRVVPQGMDIRGSVLLRNETRDGYCAQVVAAVIDRNDTIVALGRAVATCVNGSMGVDIVRSVRVEAMLRPAADPLFTVDPYARLILTAIPDTAFRVTPSNAKQVFPDPRKQQRLQRP